jgi:hypothetical protein
MTTKPTSVPTALETGTPELAYPLRTYTAINTSFIHPPIPVRKFDWVANRDGEEEEGRQGFGETEQAAIEALLELEHEEGSDHNRTPYQASFRSHQLRLTAQRLAIFSTLNITPTSAHHLVQARCFLNDFADLIDFVSFDGRGMNALETVTPGLLQTAIELGHYNPRPPSRLVSTNQDRTPPRIWPEENRQDNIPNS